ncbi:hypothetical protein [Longimicrobium sp.]|uniref:hypothetical protein n=1 Tax=Longimicrobium sp. TaxID=2029185 RepID=UPI002E30E673|nr:hypothetical protein [Longimicrobium sp.]HEX6039307.1 hypothetical protein [Longimicrobium sp.]
MNLRFGRARNGWLPTTLELDGGETLSFYVSYLPYDFVSELVAALAGVLDGPGEHVARICEEPTEHAWRFRAFDPSAVILEIITFHDVRERRGNVVARAWGSPMDVVLPLWRGLRELASRAGAEGWHKHWSEPFPADALDRLTERIEAARA